MTLVDGLAGGSLIGISAAILLLFGGEIMGASGIVNSTFLSFSKVTNDPLQHWKLFFLSSFLLISRYFLVPRFENLHDIADSRSTLAYITAGLFVGFGTKLGNGCTSGHGICGLGRLSIRSFSAVLTFMLSAVATTYMTQNDDIWRNIVTATEDTRAVANPTQIASQASFAIILFLALTGALVSIFRAKKETPSYFKNLVGLVTGCLFASGLFISGMVNPDVVSSFLNVSGIPLGTWDPSLVAVMGSGVVFSFLSYQMIDGYQLSSLFGATTNNGLSKPLVGPKFSIPTNSQVDHSLLVGAASFGVGWSLTGLCPAPALFMAAAGVPQAVFQWWPAYFVGASLAQHIKEHYV